MITLPDVTLFAIDCYAPLRTVTAMRLSTAHCRFAEQVLLTDTARHSRSLAALSGFNHGLSRLRIRLVHHVESDRKVTPNRRLHAPLTLDYEMASLREPALHVNTAHLLYIEWDSAILNPWAWDPAWLQYDFIGAPWAEHFEAGWDPCDGHTNNVGNGGFSLRSRRYCAATRELADAFKDDPSVACSDMFPCRNGRKWLEERGIVFAPEDVARRFSCENRIYDGAFGFHGKYTAELNGWGGVFAEMRAPVAPPSAPRARTTIVQRAAGYPPRAPRTH